MLSHNYIAQIPLPHKRKMHRPAPNVRTPAQSPEKSTSRPPRTHLPQKPKSVQSSPRFPPRNPPRFPTPNPIEKQHPKPSPPSAFAPPPRRQQKRTAPPAIHPAQLAQTAEETRRNPCAPQHLCRSKKTAKERPRLGKITTQNPHAPRFALIHCSVSLEEHPTLNTLRTAKRRKAGPKPRLPRLVGELYIG